MSMSPNWMVPLVGVRRRASIESSVVLPQPLAPRSSTSSPDFTSRSSPSIGRTA